MDVQKIPLQCTPESERVTRWNCRKFRYNVTPANVNELQKVQWAASITVTIVVCGIVYIMAVWTLLDVHRINLRIKEYKAAIGISQLHNEQNFAVSIALNHPAPVIQSTSYSHLSRAKPQDMAKVEKSILQQSGYGVNKVPHVHSPKSLEPIIQSTNYIDALKEVASDDNIVVLSLVDEGFTPMAINFYLTCLKPHGIENYLVLTMHPDTCKKLKPYQIKCFQYISNIEGNHKPSRYRSRIFIQKMNVRTDMIVDALEAGLSVLHTDTDVSFMKNPFKHINCSVPLCDLAVLQDGSPDYYNAGFLMIRPSALPVYQHMQQLARNNPNMDDQEQLNRAVRAVQNVKLVKLPKVEFLCGRCFYEDAKRFYADTMKPCPACVVVHNNFIVSYAAKVYRAKEVHQWMYDGDQYYSSTAREYITYTNGPKPHTLEGQMGALKTGLAIAFMLNRTLILPKFYCENETECPLNSFLIIRLFDKYFGGTYREHSFLSHVLVPKSVKLSVFPVPRPVTSVNQGDILNSYGHMTESVLIFQEFDFKVAFTNTTHQKDFNDRARFGFRQGTYANRGERELTLLSGWQ